MEKKFKIVSIIGTPHKEISNTRALVTDFVEELNSFGVNADHEVITLGNKTIKNCKGCWNCTKNAPCPVKDDDIAAIKTAMINCDMLILGSPVYTNQVTAQMKALFDRLFTWCHVFPLLGKYSLSAITTGNDGQKETGDFIEKMLGTYGTFSFGTIVGVGAFTSGFFPRRDMARQKSRLLAKKVAKHILAGKRPKKTKWLKKMFKAMKKKLSGVHVIRYLVHGADRDVPEPPRFLLWMFKRIVKKRNITPKALEKVSKLMVFEYDWWKDRGWLGVRSFNQLLSIPMPDGFSINQRLNHI